MYIDERYINNDQICSAKIEVSETSWGGKLILGENIINFESQTIKIFPENHEIENHYIVKGEIVNIVVEVLEFQFVVRMSNSDIYVENLGSFLLVNSKREDLDTWYKYNDNGYTYSQLETPEKRKMVLEDILEKGVICL